MRADSRTRNILISFDISSIAGRDQLAGVLRYLRKKPNWVPRLVAHAVDFTTELIRTAGDEKIDGIIVNHVGTPETEMALANSTIPLTVIGVRNRRLDDRTQSIAFIRNDNIETGSIAARYFLSLGNFRSYGYIPASLASEDWSLRRCEGFQEELANRKIGVEVFTHAAGTGSDDYFRSLGDWLRDLPKPAAVLASWDYPAMQAIETCRALKLKVPHDIAILGVDNDPMVCDATSPPLSSIPFDYEQEGYESAAALEALITRPACRNRPLIVACRPLPVFVRESATAVAPASELIKRALRLIEKTATKGLSAKSIARELGVSHSLLTLRFREFTHSTVTDALTDVRLKKVQQLLTTTNRSIQDITSAAGFRNVNYLKNLFRRKFEMSMREYRAANQPPSPSVTAHTNARSGKGGRAPKKRRRTRRGGSAR